MGQDNFSLERWNYINRSSCVIY